MKMKIITWNIACLPKELNFFKNPHHRIHQIMNKIL